MRSDVQIEIFGRIATLAALDAIAVAVEAEGSVDWESGVDAYGAAELLIEASEEGRGAVFTRSDTSVLFDEVTAACMEHGVSWRMEVGMTGAEAFSEIRTWKPGMEEPSVSPTDGTGPVLTLREVAAAAEKGGEAVRSLTESRMAHLEYVFVRGRVSPRRVSLEVLPEVVEAFRARDGMPSPGI